MPRPGMMMALCPAMRNWKAHMAYGRYMACERGLDCHAETNGGVRDCVYDWFGETHA